MIVEFLKFIFHSFSISDSPHSSCGEQSQLTPNLQIRNKKHLKTPSENDSTCGSFLENDDSEMMDVERSASNTPSIDSPASQLSTLHEIELVFKPLPHEAEHQDLTLTQTRYIKTTINATVDHLAKYLSMRHKFDSSEANGDAHHDVNDSSSEASLFTIYVAAGPGQYQPLVGPMTLSQINEKYWRVNRPLELFYAYKIQQLHNA